MLVIHGDHTLHAQLQENNGTRNRGPNATVELSRNWPHCQADFTIVQYSTLIYEQQ
jgi:hypothetical protein